MGYIKLKKFQMILQQAVSNGWSDIHLTMNENLYYRKKNNLYINNNFNILEKDVREIIENILNEKQLQQLNNNKVVDCAYELFSHRYRINIYSVYKGYSIAVRLINEKIIPLKEFYQQETLKNILKNNSGMVLICGATGTGKSTTLASMIDFINRQQAKHIITLEEPIEYVFNSDKSLIHQREYQVDFYDFSNAIKMAMRQDPDIIMVGEIRDQETMKACLNAGETGHLVLGTLHASSVIEAILRMGSFFYTEQLISINVQIANTLNSIIVQKLVPTLENNLSCCMEILINNSAIKNLISNNQLAQIKSQMQLNKQQGMQFIKDDIFKLYKMKKISNDIMNLYV